ncbi:hypothetical protein GCM10027594_01310 [Hymenobacter agri]
MQILGARAKAAADQKEAAQRQKQADDLGKRLVDDLKYKTESGRLFQPSFDDYTLGLPDQLRGIYSQDISQQERALKAAQIRRDTETLRIHGLEKQKYIDTAIAEADKSGRNVANYARAYANTVLTPDGKHMRATDYDPDAARAVVDSDPSTYNEPFEVAKALKDYVPTITQRVAEAGQLGGQHSADTVRGQLIAMQGGRPVFNADGTPVLNLTPETQAVLDRGAVKVLVDAREAEYNKRREADPNLPAMSRRGHLATMFGPLVRYDSMHDEALNPRRAAPKAAPKVNDHDVQAYPIASHQTSYYRKADGSIGENNYPFVGTSFGSRAKPYVEVQANTSKMEVVGKDGEPTRLNPENTNQDVAVRLAKRVYVPYVNGKRVGQEKRFSTDEESYQHLLKVIHDAPNGAKLELHVEGRGTLVDKPKTAGDGLGGAPKIIGYTEPTSSGGGKKPIYDTNTVEHNVIFPISQEIDAQLTRAMGGKWDRFTTTPQEREVLAALSKRGGRVINPYNSNVPYVASTQGGGPLAARAKAPAPVAPAPPVKPGKFGFQFKKK